MNEGMLMASSAEQYIDHMMRCMVIWSWVYKGKSLPVLLGIGSQRLELVAVLKINKFSSPSKF